MNSSADLHIHTYFSDSPASPQEVVKEAIEKGLACIAITDHDTVDGVNPTQEAAQSTSLEVLSGVELSSDLDGKDIHILGYFLNAPGPILTDVLIQMQDARIQRIQKMINKLKTLGIQNISLEEVCRLTKSRSVGRPHLAMVLYEKGYVVNVREAFGRFINDDGPAYVSKFNQTPYRAIELIRQSGGAAVLAHPMITRRDELIPKMVEAGLDGIEVYYPNFSANTSTFYETMAKKHNLLMTGGSDAHGKAKDNTFIGKVRIPYEHVQHLKDLIQSRSTNV